MKSKKPLYKNPWFWLPILLFILFLFILKHYVRVSEKWDGTTQSPDGESDISSDMWDGWIEYADNELKISFMYPEEWGEITINHEMGIDYRKIPEPIKKDEIVSHELSFTAFGERYAGHFLRGNKKNFGPMAREGYWGDLSDDIDEDTINDWCNVDSWGVKAIECTVFKNNNGIKIIRQKDAVDFMREGPITTQYLFYIPNNNFTSIAISSSSIVNNNDINVDEVEAIFNKLANSINIIQ